MPFVADAATATVRHTLDDKPVDIIEGTSRRATSTRKEPRGRADQQSRVTLPMASTR
jgi:hypothetical protein